MRVLVCGGRDYRDYDHMDKVLQMLVDPVVNYSEDGYYKDVIIHGNARGADMLSGEWAARNNVPVERYPADWDTYGKKAGPIRNQRMLDEGKLDLIVAFPGGAGTQDMIDRGVKAGVPVLSVQV